MNHDSTPMADDVQHVAMSLLKAKETVIMQLAAVGLLPRQIASAIELPEATATAFIALEDQPGSPVAKMIEAGRAIGVATPQMALQEAATAGNLEAIKELQKVQRRNKFDELLLNMDDDEFTC